MAAFDVIKKSLETMEKNVKVSRDMLESRVNSLDEMKRNRQEAETAEEKRELKIAIDSLENIIDSDKATLADLDAACKDLRKEFNKAVAEKEAREAEDHISEEEEDQASEPDERRRTYTRAELEAEVTKRGVAGLSSKFEKLCQALSEGEEEKRRKDGEDRFFRSSDSREEEDPWHPALLCHRHYRLPTPPGSLQGLLRAERPH